MARPPQADWESVFGFSADPTPGDPEILEKLASEYRSISNDAQSAHSVVARLDSAAAGFALQVYVAVSLERHDDTAHRRFAQAVRAMPEVIAADWVTGETDAMLMVVAREVAELQRVLVRLSTRGGAQRVMTLLRLEELKPASPLPLEPSR